MPVFHRTVEIADADCVRRTAKAILVEFGDQSVWVPLSQIHAQSGVQCVGDHGVLIVSAWFAEQAGIAAQAAAQVALSRLPTATKVFRRLALEHHPDRGADGRTMKALNELWSAVQEDLRNGGSR